MSEKAIIEVSELADLEPTSDVVILDCRYDLADPEAGARAYSAGHIPGARYACLHTDLSGPLGRYGGRHPLPSPAEFQQFARENGINRDSLVVVYDDSRLAFAARAWFLLHYFGHEKIAVLNGGFKAWRDAGLPLSTSTSSPAPGNFVATPRNDMLLDHRQIYRNLENPPWQLVDARDTQRFAGIEEPLDPIAGHIPTALNKPWQGVTREDGKLKSVRELRDHWQDIPADDRLVNYCGSGVTACVNLFSLYLIGCTDALLYPGSWSDWCAHIVYPETEAG
ncbi:thiosulfate/3-mercaptopyruvate sulfurtransferase [Microbulbifer donghaiensis]|uniref:Thiosulfate/3-mercaptopyruvate sulfurtransferase n=1 Tax=Microbulbifer donghaiensis TaxID=494016 RepID=A0A1M4VK21_9GAMM|nr:sulfurtransferase [Microbulbifer donghaiensis]SHE69298.1 thiosulfate/3-mercaptopyruvate sulfurtransferase [Microbulbifer donghaiensis]